MITEEKSGETLKLSFITLLSITRADREKINSSTATRITENSEDLHSFLINVDIFWLSAQEHYRWEIFT